MSVCLLLYTDRTSRWVKDRTEVWTRYVGWVAETGVDDGGK